MWSLCEYSLLTCLSGWVLVPVDLFLGSASGLGCLFGPW